MKSKLLLLSAVIIFIGITVMVVMYFIPQDVDAIFVNGVVHTMDDLQPKAEAFAVKDGILIGVGTTEEITSRFSSMNITDLGGKTVLPGFIDGHAHFLNLGIALMNIDLVGLQSETEAAKLVADEARIRQEGEWIIGRGWDQNLWKTKQFPSARSLDDHSRQNPVMLTRIDGHAVWVNTPALIIGGITAKTPDPPGGKIIRDAKGNPTGVLIDAAIQLVSSKIPPPSDEVLREAAVRASAVCNSYGITSVHDMGVSSQDIRVFKGLIDENRLTVRLYGAIGDWATWNELRNQSKLLGYGDNHLTVRSLKLFLDGALGSRGAALFEPYTDDPGNRGLTMMSESEFEDRLKEALESGFQMCVHAIGDRAIHLSLNSFEKVLGNSTNAGHRWRIEHVQILSGDDIKRFKELGVLPAMQPVHATSDMYWAEARLGPKRIQYAYAWRSLLETGSIIIGGSDFPVEYPIPFYGIHAAVNRRDNRGVPAGPEDIDKYFERPAQNASSPEFFKDGWNASEAMTLAEALKSFTIWAAIGAFEEDIKGSLTKGKLADFVILDKDPFNTEKLELYSIQVTKTYVGGVKVYEK